MATIKIETHLPVGLHIPVQGGGELRVVSDRHRADAPVVVATRFERMEVDPDRSELIRGISEVADADGRVWEAPWVVSPVDLLDWALREAWQAEALDLQNFPSMPGGAVASPFEVTNLLSDVKYFNDGRDISVFRVLRRTGEIKKSGSYELFDTEELSYHVHMKYFSAAIGLHAVNWQLPTSKYQFPPRFVMTLQSHVDSDAQSMHRLLEKKVGGTELKHGTPLKPFLQVNPISVQLHLHKWLLRNWWCNVIDEEGDRWQACWLPTVAVAVATDRTAVPNPSLRHAP